MNYKPEYRIPWLFTDFDNIKDFPWCFQKFPDFSLTLKTVTTLFILSLSISPAKLITDY